VWDVIKAGAGIMATVTSFINEGLLKIVDQLYEVIKMAKYLPTAIKPDWVDGVVDGFGTARDVARQANADSDMGQKCRNELRQVGRRCTKVVRQKSYQGYKVGQKDGSKGREVRPGQGGKIHEE